MTGRTWVRALVVIVQAASAIILATGPAFGAQYSLAADYSHGAENHWRNPAPSTGQIMLEMNLLAGETRYLIGKVVAVNERTPHERDLVAARVMCMTLAEDLAFGAGEWENGVPAEAPPSTADHRTTSRNLEYVDGAQSLFVRHLFKADSTATYRCRLWVLLDDVGVAQSGPLTIRGGASQGGIYYTYLRTVNDRHEIGADQWEAFEPATPPINQHNRYFDPDYPASLSPRLTLGKGSTNPDGTGAVTLPAGFSQIVAQKTFNARAADPSGPTPYQLTIGSDLQVTTCAAHHSLSCINAAQAPGNNFNYYYDLPGGASLGSNFTSALEVTQLNSSGQDCFTFTPASLTTSLSRRIHHQKIHVETTVTYQAACSENFRIRARVTSGQSGSYVSPISILPSSPTIVIPKWCNSAHGWYMPTAINYGPPNEFFCHGSGNATSGDKPIAGDWDNDGNDRPGIWRESTHEWFYSTGFPGSILLNPAPAVGLSGDKPLVGNWSVGGGDTGALYRPAGANPGNFYYTHELNWSPYVTLAPMKDMNNVTLTGGIGLAGDWDGDGDDTFGIFKGNVWYLNNDLDSQITVASQGGNDYQFAWGVSTDTPVVGDWDNDGTDTPGLVRATNAACPSSGMLIGCWYLNNGFDTAAEEVIQFGNAGEPPVVGRWGGQKSLPGRGFVVL